MRRWLGVSCGWLGVSCGWLGVSCGRRARAGRLLAGLQRGLSQAARQLAEVAQREHRDACADQRGQHVAALGRRLAEGGVDADSAEHREASHAQPQLADGKDADHGGEDDEDSADAPDQDCLVIRAELADREVLDRRRGVVDGQLADGAYRLTNGGGEDGGDELGYAKRHEGGDDPDDRAAGG